MSTAKKFLSSKYYSHYIPAILFIASIIYLALKSILLQEGTIDFQFIWLAGYMWNNDMNPYSAEFKALGHQLFVGGNEPEYWFYPPNWWIIAKASAVFEYETAGTIWRTFSTLLIIFGSVLTIKTYNTHFARISNLRASIFLFFISFMYGTPICLLLGQTSALIYFGIVCFITAYLNNNRKLMVISVFLLMLKPHIGILACAFLLSSTAWFSSLAWATAITILFSLPAISLSGIESFLHEYFSQIKHHEAHPFNTAYATTGLRNLFNSFFNIKTSVIAMTGIAFISSIILGWYTHRFKYSLNKSSKKTVSLSLLITFIAFFVPLHQYDLLVIAPIIILSAGFNKSYQAGIFIIFLTIFRANNLVSLVDISMVYNNTNFADNALVSIALFCLLALLMQYAISFKRKVANE